MGKSLTERNEEMEGVLRHGQIYASRSLGSS